MDKVARIILPLLLRGMGLRSDVMSSVLDDVHRASTVMSSSEFHVVRYRGTPDGEESLCSSTDSYKNSLCSTLRRGRAYQSCRDDIWWVLASAVSHC